MKLIPGTDLYAPDSETHFTGLDKQGRPMALTYQHDRVEKALSYVRGRDTAVDVGAHIGIITRFLQTKKFKHIHAFEPHPDNYECLVKNVLLDEHYCYLYMRGLGERYESVGIEREVTENSGDRHIVPAADGHACSLGPLDDYALPVLDFLKMDIQGYELFALRGAVATLARCRPVCLIEEEPPKKLRCDFGVAQGEVRKFMESLGARLVEFVGCDSIYVFPEKP